MPMKCGLASICCCLLALLISPLSYAQSLSSFDLPAQSLAVSLRAVGSQTGTNVLFDPPLVEGRRAPALKAQLTPDQAFAKLLAGTGLEYRHLDDKTITIVSATAPRSAQSEHTTSNVSTPARDAQAARLALANPTATTSNPPSVDNSQNASTKDSASGDSRREGLSEVIVTGTHIRGVEEGAAPVIVLDRAYIDSTGYTTAAQLMSSLPQNFSRDGQSGVNIPGSNDGGVQGSSIELRGTGEGTTLILINGHRMALGFDGTAPDISALPLAAIDRVEILTDGASAIYGADAVGGVVNFILRKDFDGVETRLRGGAADGNIKQWGANQLFGKTWSSGNVLFSADFQHQDLLPTSSRSFVPPTTFVQSLSPRDNTFSLMANGRQDLTDEVSVFSDVLYTHRDSFNRASGQSLLDLNATDVIKNPQVGTSLGLDWHLGAWQIEGTGSYARNDLNLAITGLSYDDPSIGGAFLINTLSQIESGELKADGPLLSIPGGAVKAAIGAAWRRESYRYSSAVPVGTVYAQGDESQQVKSLYSEINIPVFGQSNAMPGLRRLEFSLAARYDDYSTFGSSTSPELGALWSPTAELTVRADFGKSYRAPRLKDFDTAGNSAFAYYGPDPGVASGTSHILQIGGVDTQNLRAQRSKNFSTGLDFKSTSISGLTAGVSYYNIQFDNQIANPASSYLVYLSNPAAFSNLFIRNPSVAQVNQGVALGTPGQGFFADDENGIPTSTFDPASVNLLVDLRRRNLSETRTSGLDFRSGYSLETGVGKVGMGVTGTYVFDLRQQITSTSPQFDAVNTIYNPPHLRLRGAASWQRKQWSANVFINYTGDYEDNRTVPSVPIGSYTTVDGRLAFAFGDGLGLAFSHLAVSLSVQNLLNRDPPRVAIINGASDIGFDPTNANPLGRVVLLSFIKSW